MEEVGSPSKHYNYDKVKGLFLPTPDTQEGAFSNARISVSVLPPGNPLGGSRVRYSVALDFVDDTVMRAAIRQLLQLIPKAADELLTPTAADVADEWSHVDDAGRVTSPQKGKKKKSKTKTKKKKPS
jgi:hypothetical protein